MKQPSQRQLRVSEQIRGVISETLHRGHFHDAVLVENAAAVTVGHVDVSPDLKNCSVYVMTLGGAKMDVVLPALNKIHAYFQTAINQHLNIKFTPRVTFKEDKTFAEAEKIEKLLQQIK